MTKEKCIELLKEFIEQNGESIIPLHNEYCNEVSDWGEYVENMDFLGENFYGMSINEFLSKYNLKNLNINDDYYQVTDNWEIVSFDGNEFETIYAEEIAEMIEENALYYSRNCYVTEILEILEEYIEEDDEEDDEE